MPFFAMIHWGPDSISPVIDPDSVSGNAMLWPSVDEAKRVTDAMPIAQAREITIHSIEGDV
jgi:hypothetical protein